MKVMNQPTFVGASVAVNQTGTPFDVSECQLAAAQGVFTGTGITGTLKLQGSLDPANSSSTTAAPTNFTDIAGATIAVGAAGSFMIPITQLCYNWIRLVYVFSAGTGTVTANVKAIG